MDFLEVKLTIIYVLVQQTIQVVSTYLFLVLSLVLLY